MLYIYDVLIVRTCNMLNNENLEPGIEPFDEIDLDRMAQEAEQLRAIRGTTVIKENLGLREWLKPVGRVVNPSFGGRIEVPSPKHFDDEQDRYRCGR